MSKPNMVQVKMVGPNGLKTVMNSVVASRLEAQGKLTITGERTSVPKAPETPPQEKGKGKG